VSQIVELREKAAAALKAARDFVAVNPNPNKDNQRELDTRYAEAIRAIAAFEVASGLTRPSIATDDAVERLNQLSAWMNGPAAGGMAGLPFPGDGGAGGRSIALKREQSIASYMTPTGNDGLAGLGLGGFVAGLVTGRWPGVGMTAQMSVGSGPGGGYLVPAPLAGRVIDLARNRARVIQAGAQTIPMTSSTLAIAKVAADPASEWKPENDPAVGTDMTLDRVLLTAKTLMVGPVKVSVELTEDAANVDEVIESAVADSVALEIDRAALYGSAVGAEPRGLKETAGVDETAVGDLTDYDPFSLAVQRLWTDNETPNAVIYAVDVAGLVDRLKDLEERPLEPPASFRELATYQTKQVQSGHAFVGDWSQLLIGMRTELVIEASREAGDDAGGAFRSRQVWIRGYTRLDIAVARTSAFDILTDITAVGS